MKLWAHFLTCIVFLVAPMWALNPIVGGFVAVLVLFAVELVDGRFDDLIETDVRPWAFEDEVRRRLNDGDGA